MKLACFIHSTNLPIQSTDILCYLINYLRDTEILSLFEHVFINNIGTEINSDMFTDDNIIITNYSTDANFYENCTLRQLHFFSQLHPDYKILYLHTKGIGYANNHPYRNNIMDWINYMLYCLVNRLDDCIDFLDTVDVVGCNYRNHLFYENPDHYSGNFWWACSNYIKTMNVAKLSNKYDAEFWLFKNNPTFINIYSSGIGHYQNPYPLEIYKEPVTKNIQDLKYILTNIRTLKILYGANDKYIDVTDICRKKLIDSKGILRIPAGDNIRNDIFTDPVYGVVKHIKIRELKFSYENSICIPYS